MTGITMDFHINMEPTISLYVCIYIYMYTYCTYIYINRDDIVFFSDSFHAYVDIVYSLQKEENHVENPMAQLLTAGKRGVACFHMAEKRPTKKVNIDEHEVTRSYTKLQFFAVANMVRSYVAHIWIRYGKTLASYMPRTNPVICGLQTY